MEIYLILTFIFFGFTLGLLFLTCLAIIKSEKHLKDISDYYYWCFKKENENVETSSKCDKS